MGTEITRRSLLAGIAALPVAAPAAAKLSKMKFGLTSYQWGQDWDIPTMIANCTKAKALAVELRTSAKYAHGVEIDIGSEKRAEVKKRFADSPVALIGIASAERMDAIDPAKLKAAIEGAKAHVKLSHDVGSRSVRVFPNDFHKEEPEEKTIERIAAALSEVGKFAADFGQGIRVENHGTAGRLVTLRKVIDRVDAKNVRVMLNCDKRDTEDDGFAKNFALVKHRLADMLHMHDLLAGDFPYELQADLLIDEGWEGWWLVEQSTKVPDRVQALIEMRTAWEAMVAKSLKRSN
jgi:sugar phosphate isomerase/epimerase